MGQGWDSGGAIMAPKGADLTWSLQSFLIDLEVKPTTSVLRKKIPFSAILPQFQSLQVFPQVFYIHQVPWTTHALVVAQV